MSVVQKQVIKIAEAVHINDKKDKMEKLYFPAQNLAYDSGCCRFLSGICLCIQRTK